MDRTGVIVDGESGGEEGLLLVIPFVLEYVAGADAPDEGIVVPFVEDALLVGRDVVVGGGVDVVVVGVSFLFLFLDQNDIFQDKERRDLETRIVYHWRIVLESEREKGRGRGKLKVDGCSRCFRRRGEGYKERGKKYETVWGLVNGQKKLFKLNYYLTSLQKGGESEGRIKCKVVCETDAFYGLVSLN